MKTSHFVAVEPARLLVADDDPILREFAIANLSTPELEVEVACDGIAAWQRLERRDIDIALIDLDMPGMNGFELIERIRWDEALKHLPIVVATGREDMVAVDRAYGLGATAFVVKPLNWRLLLHQLAYVLKNSRAEAEVRKELKMLQNAADLKDRILRLSRQKLVKPLNIIVERARQLTAMDAGAEVAACLRDIATASVDVSLVCADMQEAERAIGR
ncbi:MAG: response regulator [Asticcacaulis sp.]